MQYLGGNVADTFFFYDLETSGVDPRSSRIMQFAGQRTDLDLKPVGEPVNILIKLTDDILPDPDAVLLTGITPQKTLAEGITEAEFCKIFIEEIAAPNTIFAGFNSVRFDDEFMRFLLYRNFFDAYEWQWKDGRSRWDILDVARMTRALRPDGIKWPFDSDGKPTNRLEFLTSVNKLEHTDAHDALADVKATIAVASLIRDKQSKLFDYMLGMRDKKKVSELVGKNEPFVYTSGKYPAEYEKTAVVAPITSLPENQGTLVFDLRHDPSQYASLSPEKLAELWKYDRESKTTPLPVKTLRANRCPAIAPLGVLDEVTQKRLGIDLATIKKHLAILRAETSFGKNLVKALDILQAARTEQTAMIADERLVDSQLYDGFVGSNDKQGLEKIRTSNPEKLAELAAKLHDERLQKLVPLYKARNYPRALSDEERTQWEEYRKHVLIDGGEQSQLTKFSKRLMELGDQSRTTDERRYLLEELRLYAESVLPDF
jgi:exodeoxyribonuclease-1